MGWVCGIPTGKSKAMNSNPSIAEKRNNKNKSKFTGML
jgi:hypothetical protein